MGRHTSLLALLPENLIDFFTIEAVWLSLASFPEFECADIEFPSLCGLSSGEAELSPGCSEAVGVGSFSFRHDG